MSSSVQVSWVRVRPLCAGAFISLTLVLLAWGIPPYAQAATPGAFENLAESPAPLTSVTVDPSTNIIYAQKNQGTAFYSYAPSTDTWSELAEAPVNSGEPPVASGNNGGAAYLDGKIYTSYTGDPRTLGVYDIASESWSTIPNPLKMGTADIAAAGNQLYMVDGTSFVSYDPATEKTSKLAAAPSWYESEGKGGAELCEAGFEAWGGLQAFDGRIYGDQGNGCRGFAAYDIETNSWSELPPLPEGAVAGSAIDPVSGTYFAYGTYEQRDFYRYEIATEQWSTVTFPFSQIEDGGMAYVSLPGLHGIYAAQGEAGSGFTRYVTPEAEGEAELSLTNSPSATQAAVGGDITYTLHVTNGGPSEATNATLHDPLPANVRFLSVVASRGNCAGTATVVCDLGTLATGGSATVTITVEAIATGTAANEASVSSEEPAPDTHASATAETSISTEADLALADTPSVTSTTLGSQFSYALRVSNAGPSSADGVSLTDKLPGLVTFLSASVSQGACTGSSVVSCSLGTLAKGGAVTVLVTVTAAATGTAEDDASVSSETPDPNLPNNRGGAAVQITTPAPAPSPPAPVSGSALAGTPSGSSPPPPPPAAALKPARLLLAGGRLRLVHGSRAISASLQNVNSQLAISGSVRLAGLPSGHPKSSPTLASGFVYLPAGSTKTLSLALDAAGLRKLRQMHRLKVELVMTFTDPTGRKVKETGVYLLEEVPAPKRTNKHGK